MHTIFHAGLLRILQTSAVGVLWAKIATWYERNNQDRLLDLGTFLA